MKLASTFHNKYGIPTNLSEPLADTMKSSLLRRHPGLVPYPHPLPRIVDQWQLEKQAAHLMETTAKAGMLLLLMKTPFKHVWMLCVVVDFSTLFSILTHYGTESNMYGCSWIFCPIASTLVLQAIESHRSNFLASRHHHKTRICMRSASREE